jgi:glycosyltransferase involved in cell wall biosynthesis
LLSVCIPTYNTARYLPEAIESVLAQTHADFELVVCDNASTDDTPELCRRYAGDPRFRYVRFEDLVGQGGNWNRCVRLAQGEHVALLHADDRYLPGFLAARLAALESDPDLGMAFGAVRLIDPEGAPLGEQSFAPEPRRFAAGEFLPQILDACVVSPVSPVVRRDAYRALPPFSESRLWGIDWEMWIRVAARWGVDYNPEPLAEYRTHAASGTSRGLLEARNGPEERQVLERVFADGIPDRWRGLRGAAYRSLATRTLYYAAYNADRKHLPGLRRNLGAAFRTHPAICLKPTFLALGLSTLLGPWVYRSFRRLRPDP